MKKHFAYSADMYKSVVADVLLKDKDEEFQRYSKLLYTTIYSHSRKGKGQLQLKLKNNIPSPEMYEKLRTYFVAEGFKFWGNNFPSGFVLGISWI